MLDRVLRTPLGGARALGLVTSERREDDSAPAAECSCRWVMDERVGGETLARILWPRLRCTNSAGVAPIRDQQYFGDLRAQGLQPLAEIVKLCRTMPKSGQEDVRYGARGFEHLLQRKRPRPHRVTVVTKLEDPGCVGQMLELGCLGCVTRNRTRRSWAWGMTRCRGRHQGTLDAHLDRPIKPADAKVHAARHAARAPRRPSGR